MTTLLQLGVHPYILYTQESQKELSSRLGQVDLCTEQVALHFSLSHITEYMYLLQNSNSITAAYDYKSCTS